MECYGTQPFHNGCGLTARRWTASRRWTAAGTTTAGTRCRWTVASRAIPAGSSSAKTAIAAAAIGLTASRSLGVLAQESVCALGLAARQQAVAVAIKLSYQTGSLLWSQLRSASFAAFSAFSAFFPILILFSRLFNCLFLKKVCIGKVSTTC